MIVGSLARIKKLFLMGDNIANFRSYHIIEEGISFYIKRNSSLLTIIVPAQ